MRPLKHKSVVVITASLFLLLVVVFSYINYSLKNDLVKNEYSNQKKIAKTIEQSLNLFFRTLVFITESTASNREYDFEKNHIEDKIRFNDFSKEDLLKGFNVLEKKNQTSGLWQVYKGLPETFKGKHLAESRREIARNILANNPELHYVFEMDVNGDLVFLEPYTTQVGITSFNYGFRDYLKLAKTHKRTVLSEGYLSHDKGKTQILTVASPIFNKKGEIKRVFAVSISSKSIKDIIFQSLRKSLEDLDDGYLFLIDRHGHVIASTSDHMIYSPTVNNKTDSDDVGNLRGLSILKSLKWDDDIFEKGNLWERNTKSWDKNSLKEFYTNEFTLNNATQLGTLYPVSVLNNNKMWGVVVSTSKEKIDNAINHILWVSFLIWLTLSSIILYVTLSLIGRNSKLEKKHHEDKMAIEAMNAQIAHDIRSPASLLKKIIEKDLLHDEDKRQMHTLVKRISDISNQILGLKTSKHDDRSLTVLETVKMIVDEKNIQYQLFPNISFESIIFIDESVRIDFPSTDLARILSNLLNNSFDSLIDQDGQIRLKVQTLEDNVIFEITDNGVGMLKSELDQAISGFSSKKTGNGIGLSSSRAKILQAGGSFSIVSNKGVGTRIHFSLKRKSLLKHQSPKVVLLEDDKFIRLNWENEFRKSKLALETYSSPKKLLEAMDSYDSETVLILDSCNFTDEFYDLIKALRQRDTSNTYLYSGFEKSKFQSLNLSDINLLPKDYDLKKLVPLF